MMQHFEETNCGGFNLTCLNAPNTWWPAVYWTPSFFCRLVDEVVYWNTTFWSG